MGLARISLVAVRVVAAASTARGGALRGPRSFISIGDRRTAGRGAAPLASRLCRHRPSRSVLDVLLELFPLNVQDDALEEPLSVLFLNILRDTAISELVECCRNPSRDPLHPMTAQYVPIEDVIAVYPL